MTQAPLSFATQPFMKLASANMALLMRFGASPEVASQAQQAAGLLMQQAGATTMKLMQTGAFAQLVQGMSQNYAEFLAESGRSAVTMLTDGQAALARNLAPPRNGR